MCKHLENHSAIPAAQNGLIVEECSLKNILHFVNEVMKRTVHGHRAEVCCMEFSKAFDSVNSRRLDRRMK